MSGNSRWQLLYTLFASTCTLYIEITYSTLVAMTTDLSDSKFTVTKLSLPQIQSIFLPKFDCWFMPYDKHILINHHLQSFMTTLRTFVIRLFEWGGLYTEVEVDEQVSHISNWKLEVLIWRGCFYIAVILVGGMTCLLGYGSTV